MTITSIYLPDDFGNDAAKDLHALRSFLRHQGGKIFWIVRPGARIKIGDEAGTIDTHGYREINIRGKRIKSHRAVWLFVNGFWPKEVDHINGIKNDNRIQNLREVDHQENTKNRKKPSNNTSGAIGVSRQKRDGKWQAYIVSNGHRYYLGTFVDIKDAVRARSSAEIHHCFHENHGR